LWLEFMLQVLEEDWTLRHGNEDWKQSLIWQFIQSSTGESGRSRRIMRALFADGTPRTLNEFTQMFKGELKEPPKDADKIKRTKVKVSVDEEIYGDWMENDSDVSENETAVAGGTSAFKKRRMREPSSRRITPRNSSRSLRGNYENNSGNELD